ncbi:RNA polymerase sigma factor [Alkalihalobacillus sp. 1P02AB]|uniref:RNA polymerase sigma factor n=1 Tax=Alkalihalobacillus sp. 1P02AB TaxID=3132260 RepID=UPI0039A4983D
MAKAWLKMEEENSTGKIEEFERKIQLLYPNLFQYCLRLTNSKWDAEELLQNTLVKVLKSLNDKELTYAYLAKIASHTWIDSWRKRKIEVEHNVDLTQIKQTEKVDYMEVEAALEKLAYELTNRQQALILLVDVFQCTLAEVSDMFQTSEGAIKSALHRARKRLDKLSKKEAVQRKTSALRVQALLEAVRTQDLASIVLLGTEEESYLQMVHNHQQHKRMFQAKPQLRDQQEPTLLAA